MVFLENGSWSTETQQHFIVEVGKCNKKIGIYQVNGYFLFHFFLNKYVQAV
jgi:hypothetical protein